MTVPRFDYRVGDLLVDIGRQTVVRDGMELRLPRLSFDALCVLITAAPNLVANAELMRHAWRGTVVSLETVTQRIKLLRDALGDDPQNPRYIIGLRGRGYRLLPPVEHQGGSSGDDESGVSGSSPPSRTIRPCSTTAIAILPFRDLSELGNGKYLAEGLTEELVCRSSMLPGLRVPALSASTNCLAAHMTIPETARALNVALILNGSVRRAGDRLRVSVQLIRASGHYLWSRSYDRRVADALTLEDELATQIVYALQATLATGLESEWPRDLDDDPYDLWMRSVQAWRKGTRNSFEDMQWLLERAVRIAPNFATAWADLGNLYVHRAIGDYATINRGAFANRARYAAMRAAALAPHCSRSHLIVHEVRQRVDHDCRKAEIALHRAFELEPTNPAVLGAMARVDAWHGRRATAIGRAEEAASMDSRDGWNWFSLGLIYSLAGRYDDALAATRQFAAAAPQALMSASTLAWAELDVGRPAAALATLASVDTEEFPNQFRPAILDSLGRKEEADAWLGSSTFGRYNKLVLAKTYLRRGDLDRAIDCLGRLVPADEHPEDIRALPIDASLADLRKHRLWPGIWRRMQRELIIPT